MFGVLNSRKRRCYLIKCVKKSRLGLEKSRNVTFLVLVSSRSRKIVLQKSRSRLGLENLTKCCSWSRLGLETLTRPGFGLVSVSKKVVSSNPGVYYHGFLYSLEAGQ